MLMGIIITNTEYNLNTLEILINVSNINILNDNNILYALFYFN